MELSRAYDSQELFKLVEAYFSENKTESEYAEASLLEKTLSGEDLVGILSELEMRYRGKLIQSAIQLEELQKDHSILETDYQALSLSNSQLEDYVEKYRPLIDTIVSIIQKTARDEAKTLIKQIENKYKHPSKD